MSCNCRGVYRWKRVLYYRFCHHLNWIKAPLKPQFLPPRESLNIQKKVSDTFVASYKAKWDNQYRKNQAFEMLQIKFTFGLWEILKARAKGTSNSGIEVTNAF